MEQGDIIQHPLTLASDYSLSSDPDCIDSFPTSSQHSGYTSGGAVDPIRRDGTLQNPGYNLTTKQAPTGHHFVSDSGVGSDGTGYRTANTFSDSSGGSISASPSSAVSSHGYHHYQTHHSTNLPGFPNAVPLPQEFGAPSFGQVRISAVSDAPTGHIIPSPYTLNPIRPPILVPTNASGRDSYAYSNSYVPRTHLSPTGYLPYTDPSRSVIGAPTLPLSHLSSGYPPTPMANGNTRQEDCATHFKFAELQTGTALRTERQEIAADLKAKVDKGFFIPSGEDKWTCYRRNYFSVTIFFWLIPAVINARLFVKRDGESALRQVQALGVKLSAAVDGAQGKNIELIQHTPKRDQGPKTKIEVVKVSPTQSSDGRPEHSVSSHNMQGPMHGFYPTGITAGPFLPLQNVAEESDSPSNSQAPQQSGTYPYGTQGIQAPGPNTQITFERVQFKSATANNGKRRASQQYFHLIVELYADIRKDGAKEPQWVRVVHRVSDKIVVRGRSPSHYQEGQNAGRGGGSQSGSGYNAAASMGYGGQNTGGFRGASSPYSGLSGPTGHHHYGPNAYGADSPGSPGSADGGASDDERPMDTVMADADRGGMQDIDGYSYHPTATYEHVPLQLPPPPKMEGFSRCSTDPRQYQHAIKIEYPEAIPGPQWSCDSHNRFQGFGTSRGYFPEFGTPSGYS